MTHLLDTLALLAHYLAEPGATRVRALFEDRAVVAGTSILALFEFDLRLHQLGVDATTRAADPGRYRGLLIDVVNVDEVIRSQGVHLRISATAHASAIDTLIAATASVRGATRPSFHGDSNVHAKTGNAASEIGEGRLVK
jgi:hypothetical protein